MSNTGIKTSEVKLGSLILSVDRLVYAYPQRQNTPLLSVGTQESSYIQRLQNEHGKVIKTTPFKAIDRLNSSSDLVDFTMTSILKLDPHQMIPVSSLTSGSLPPILPKETPANANPENSVKTHGDTAKSVIDNASPRSTATYVLKSYVKPKNASFTHPMTEIHKRPVTKTVAPRALPFSKETHVRVKIVSKKINPEGNTSGTAATERFCWMQRDAIKHYLCIQDIEKQRAATKGAVYRSFEHDA